MDPLYNGIRYNSKIRYNVNSVCTKISGSCIWSHVFLQENIRFGYLLELPHRGDSNKYTKRMICKKLFKIIRYSCFRRVHIKFLYNSKLDFTSKPLVTNAVVITRVLCTEFKLASHKALLGIFTACNCFFFFFFFFLLLLFYFCAGPHDAARLPLSLFQTISAW